MVCLGVPMDVCTERESPPTRPPTLPSIPNTPKDGTRLKLVPVDYDLKQARAHARRLKDLLTYPPGTCVDK